MKSLDRLCVSNDPADFQALLETIPYARFLGIVVERDGGDIITALLAVWAFVSYGLGIVGVEALNRYHLGGFPLGFWFAQQGAIYVFVALIAIYALAMDRIDRRYGVHVEPGDEEEADGESAP